MLESMNTNTLEYQRLSKDEMESRGILGRLIGVCADIINPTRNGRKYPEQLWENVFKDPIMKERIENGVCYGELGHPPDREETDMEKIALCLAEVPKKGKDGKLRAVFDILNTPNGRILKSLCDYGSTIGISSRGSGDLDTDFDGNESVNPDTYCCEGFDAVLIPAVKEARLQYVTESLNKKRYNKTLRQKLTESINKEDESNQKIMKESLDTLGINLSDNVTESISIGSNTRNSFNEIQIGDTIIYNVDEFDGNVSQECTVTDVDTDHIILSPKEDPDLKYWIDSDIEFNTVLNEARDIGDDNGFLAYQKQHQASDDEVEFVKQIEHDLIDTGLDTKDGSYVKVKNLLVTKPTDNNIYFTIRQTNTDDVDSVVNKIDSVLSKYNAEDVKYNQADLLKDYVYCHGSCKINNINEDLNIEEVANDQSLVEELQKALKLNKSLDEKIVALQEKLSVGYAKEVKLVEQIEDYKSRIIKLSKANNEVKALNEKLNTITKSQNASEVRCEKLTESVQMKNQSLNKLKESLQKKKDDIKLLNKKIDESNKNLKQQQLAHNELLEKYESLDKDMTQLKESYSNKLESQNKLIEKYKGIAIKSVNKYIDTQANMLGIKSSEIKNRLPESYSFKDIDLICEDLREYKLNMSNLPFSTHSGLQEGLNISAKHVSRNNLIPQEEDIDDLTLRLAGLK